MENQKKGVLGSHEITLDEKELIARIKVGGAKLLALQQELSMLLTAEYEHKSRAAWESKKHSEDNSSQECAQLMRYQSAEPTRWAEIGKTSIQYGIMALIRAIERPNDC